MFCVVSCVKIFVVLGMLFVFVGLLIGLMVVLVGFVDLGVYFCGFVVGYMLVVMMVFVLLL